MHIYNVLLYITKYFHILTSFLKPLHRFASNFMWMFHGWIPKKFAKSGCYPYLYGIMGNFVNILANS